MEFNVAAGIFHPFATIKIRIMVVITETNKFNGKFPLKIYQRSCDGNVTDWFI